MVAVDVIVAGVIVAASVAAVAEIVVVAAATVAGWLDRAAADVRGSRRSLRTCRRSATC